MLVEAAGALLEDLARGDRFAESLRRIGLAEELDEERLHPVGAARLAAGDAGLPEDDHDAGDERGQDHRTGGHRQAVAADEFARPVTRAVGLRGDRATVEKAHQVVAQGGGRGVAARRLAVQGLEGDRVEVAGEARREAAHNLALRLALVGTRRDHRRTLEGFGIHRAHQRGERPPSAVERRPSGQQLEEERPHRVDVGGGRHRLAEDLFRRSVGGGERLAAELRLALVEGLGLEELGDAEVEQLHPPARSDQNVGWLEIPMDHQLAVRGVDRVRDLDHQLDPSLERRRPLLAPDGDRRPFDILEHEVRVAVVGRTAVEQVGDSGMVQPGENLALTQEPVGDRLRIEAGPDALDGHLLLELAVGALGEEDLSHAAFAEAAHQPVGTDRLRFRRARGTAGSGRRGRRGSDGLVRIQPGGSRFERRSDEHRGARQDRRPDERLLRAVGGEQCGDEPREVGVTPGDLRQSRRTHLHALLDQLVEEALPGVLH